MISSHSRLALISLSILALVLLTFLALDFYNIRAENEETSRLLNLTNETENEKALVQSIRLAQNNAALEIAAFEALVLTDTRLVPVIESIEEAGRSLGLETEIDSVDKSEPVTDQNFQKVTLVIETTGPWGGSFQFLKALESLPNRISIEESRLSKGQGAWVSRTTLSLYSFRD